MRVLLLRIGALGTVAVLGWIAIANAQRGSNDQAAEDSDGGGSLSIAEAPARPVLAPPSGDVNPLRRSAAATTPRPYSSSAATSRTPAAAPASRPPASDPFGLVARRGGSTIANTVPPPATGDAIPDASAIGLSRSARSAAAPSRYTQGVTPASSEQPSTGPALTATDRYPAMPDQVARRGKRYVAPPATKNQEPAQLKEDPFARPATPIRAPMADRGGLGVSAGGNRAGEIAAEVEGTGQPGDKRLEGVQSPQLTIQKIAPQEIQVGKPAKFTITVRNTGAAPARQVEVRDVVPKGTRLLGTTGQSSRGTRGEIVWALGTIRPGEEASVGMQLMPTAEGEIGSVATVLFGADASARSIATRPQLVVETAAPQTVLIGDQVTLGIKVSNPGTGVATGVVLTEHIPPGLQHPAGKELEYQVGDLKPGESRKLELPLVASRAGLAANRLTARGDGDLRAEHKIDLEVLAPQLDVAFEGPKRRFLERQATYQLSVANPGTASAKQVELIATLPAGLKFVSANNAGYFEESTRTVRWRLEELPAGEAGSVELVTLPINAGQQAIALQATAERGLAVKKEQPVKIEGIAAILFQVADTTDPIEIGGETAYEIRIINQGTKAAANVRLTIDLPPEVKLVAAEGPTRYQPPTGNRVVFDGLASLAPKADTAYRIRVRAVRPGDLRTSFLLQTDEMQRPVVKEESTRVFADE